MKDTKVRRQNPRVSMSMVEVYNELVKDLLQVPGGGSAYLDLHETPEKGVHVKVSSLLQYLYRKWNMNIYMISTHPHALL